MRKLILVLVILSLPSISQLFVPGFFGASDDLHIAWLHQFNKTIFDAGQIPPRYVPDLSYGFGYPLFNFVFPLPFMIGQVVYLISDSLVGSVKSVFALSFIFSAIGMALVSKKLKLSNTVSLLAGLLYLYAPYRATDVYIRGALGESLAISIFPWLVYFAISKLNRLTIPVFGIFIASLILSHNISALLFVPILMVLLVIKNNLKYGLLSIAIGLLISSFFWIPALLDSTYMVKDTVFNPLDHFPTLKQLITPYWGYGASVPGPYDGMSFFQGFYQLAFGLVGIVLILFTKSKKIYVWSTVVLLISIFLMNHRSQILWENLPLIGYVQFPWRLQFLTVLTLSILSLLVISKIPKSILLIIVPAILLTTTYMFAPNEQLGRNDNYFLERYIPVPQASYSYTQTKEEYLRLPKATSERPSTNLPLVTTNNSNNIQVVNINSLKYIIKTNFSNNETVYINRYLFPGWVVLDKNNKELKLTAAEPYGQISFLAGSGEQAYEVIFQQTNRNKVLNVISLVVFTLSILSILFTIISKKNE